MTWQRIDENAYIDDTLVTCAEYQLFIDEMREQGKYYQPDHWTSYQYPKGQAREPVLGMRHSDAVAFCEWLTRREAGEWHYRLPRQEEVSEHPLQLSSQFSLGYWIMEIDDQSEFTWIGPTPMNVHVLDITRTFHLALTIIRRHTHELTQTFNFGQSTDFINVRWSPVYDHDAYSAIGAGNISWAVDQAIKTAKTLIRDLDKAEDLASVSTYAGDIMDNLSLAVDLTSRLADALAIDRDRAITRKHATGRGQEIVQLIDSDLTHAHALIRGLSTAHEHTFKLAHALDLARDLSTLRDTAGIYNFNIDLARARALDRNLEIDIVTLQERIAGRSPAFEGIRLVKERK